MSILAQTWGEYLTGLWNTEVWSWESAFALLVVILVFGR